MRIGLLSAAFPPDKDGIGDYTFRLDGESSGNGNEVTVLTSSGRARLEGSGADVVPFYDPARPASIRCLVGELVETRAFGMACGAVQSICLWPSRVLSAPSRRPLHA